jgi:hypothetical protein
MGIFDFNKIEWDKKYIIGYLITLLMAIICGIVLYKIAYFNIYFSNFANTYIYYVFNFNNSALFFSHFLSELFYLSVFFLIVYFTKLKYLTLLFLFVKSLFIVLYSIILCVAGGFGGLLVTLVIFLPVCIISLFLCLLLSECCKLINKRYVFFVPVALALLISVIFLILVNVIFRLIIVIV